MLFRSSVTEAEDEDLGINITGAFGWAPQSMGMSFVHAGDVITVDLRAGVYAKVDGDEDRWQRRQLSERDMVDITSSGRREVLDGRALLSWRSRHHAGKRLTTVSLSNAREVAAGEAKRYTDLCLFQVSMSCTDDGGLSPYPQGNVYASPEDRELAFRYRNKPSFAIRSEEHTSELQSH